MVRRSSKTPIKIIVDIKSVKLAEVTPAQHQQWKRWWARLISEIRAEVKGERKPTIAKRSGPVQSSEEMGGNSDAQG